MILSQLLSGSTSSAANSAANGAASTTGSVSADVYAKVNKLMQAQNTEAPKLNAALASDNTRLSGLGKLLNSLSSFQAVSKSLAGSGLYVSASTSSNGVLTAATSSSTVAGTYAIQVNQLAQSQRLTAKPQASPDTPIGGSGSSAAIKIDFGSTAGGVFTQSGASKTVLVRNGDNSLNGIAAAINAAKIGVSATVAQSSAGYTLVLTSPSGSANSLRIGVSGNPTLQGLLAYNPAGTKNLSQTAAAQNAVLTVNGVTVSSPDNTVSGAVDGATLNLTATGATTLQVTRDTAQLAKNINALVGTYNTLSASLSGLQQGDLKSDAAVAQIQSQLSKALNTTVSGSNGAPPLSLATIGISLQKNGTLAVDAAKLQKAIDADPAGVAKLFTNNGKGIADALTSQIQDATGSSGIIQKESMALNKDISSLNAKKSSLETALTAKTNALVKLYSQQSAQGGSSAAGATPGANATLFDWLW